MHRYCVAGFWVNVYGLELIEDPRAAKDLNAVVVLHGRTQSAQKPLTVRYAENIVKRRPGHILAITFDARNHGTRLIDELANKDYEEGNPRHAQDLYGLLRYTAQDVSTIIDLLPTLMFPADEARIRDWLVTGISLGGHACYHVLANDTRVSAAVIVVGCPSFEVLMRNRIGNNPSISVPQSLWDLVAQQQPSADASVLVDKHLLILGGAKDILVPPAVGQPFLDKLAAHVVEKHGQTSGRLEVKIYADAGHEFSSAMMEHACEYIGKYYS